MSNLNLKLFSAIPFSTVNSFNQLIFAVEAEKKSLSLEKSARLEKDENADISDIDAKSKALSIAFKNAVYGKKTGRNAKTMGIVDYLHLDKVYIDATEKASDLGQLNAFIDSIMFNCLIPCLPPDTDAKLVKKLAKQLAVSSGCKDVNGRKGILAGDLVKDKNFNTWAKCFLACLADKLGKVCPERVTLYNIDKYSVVWNYQTDSDGKVIGVMGYGCWDLTKKVPTAESSVKEAVA